MEFTVYGEPASKANSRRLVPEVSKSGKRFTRSIKSEKALSYLEDFARQGPVTDPLLAGHLRLDVVVFYASLRPDLDVSLIEDAMQ